MAHRQAVLALLSDGRFHSGQAIGQVLGVTRAKVWQILKALNHYGITVESVRGRGYRLSTPISLMDTEAILSCLTTDTKTALNELELFFTLDSTNSYLMQKARQGAASGTVCLAEHQSAGMGRRGRSWTSPLARNIYLSLLWRFSDGPSHLGGLSLIMAMAVVEAIESLGISGLSVKWPNDIVIGGKKAGGILMEVGGESNGPCYVVVGIGLNVDMPQSAGKFIGQAWANISESGTMPSRSILAATLINYLFEALQRFQKHGPAPYFQRWNRFDYIDGKEVNIHLHDRIVCGVARGIDERGCLRVAHGDQITHYSSGEVSLRLSGNDDDSTV